MDEPAADVDRGSLPSAEVDQRGAVSSTNPAASQRDLRLSASHTIRQTRGRPKRTITARGFFVREVEFWSDGPRTMGAVGVLEEAGLTPPLLVLLPLLLPLFVFKFEPNEPALDPRVDNGPTEDVSEGTCLQRPYLDPGTPGRSGSSRCPGFSVSLVPDQPKLLSPGLGRLPDRRDIAVKKLSQASKQGKNEFVNEAKLLAKVQQRNVEISGVIARTKMMTSFWSMKSNTRSEIDWKQRFEIITCIARGLLYLHEDAPNCILHMDINTGNILLDEKWVPKIADFGMARISHEDATHVNTRVAGTNGQKNSSFSVRHPDQTLLEWNNLLGDFCVQAIRAQFYGMIGRRRQLVMVYSLALIVDEPGGSCS
ncbi:hypothetical protein DY000_02040779 [Brassica cretica]|uniref:Protein kinase domain-containing protein n=1 Tax=Brassica cretica TaxID=69181 RepID=A0ABQ7BI45_BRACR|nr:hypothetical protein DY000_02040779 [Brassica cretica]